MIICPEVIVEQAITDGLQDLKDNPALIDTIFRQNSVEYRTEVKAFVAAFAVPTILNYYFDAAQLPSITLLLSSDGIAQRYLNDSVEDLEQIDAEIGEDYSEVGNDWRVTIELIVSTKKPKQTMVLYNLLKYILIKYNPTFEENYLKNINMAAGAITYSKIDEAFIYSRSIRFTCDVLCTVETDVSADEQIETVVSAYDSEVRGLSQENVGG